MELRHPWLQGPLRLSPGWTGATLSAQSLRAPAAALSALGSPWNTLAPQGTLELKWQTLPLGGPAPGHWPNYAGATPPPRWRRSIRWAATCCACKAMASPAARWP